MSTHRVRRRGPTTSPVDHAQDEVDDLAAELLALWRVMPSAVARDSAGLLTGDRHAKGAVKGSPAAVNLSVVDAAVIIETGLEQLAAEAVRLLNYDDRPRRPLAIIAALPVWHRALANRGQPLARHLRRDLERWVREARGAVGTRRLDTKLGPLCPDHRDTKPAPLLRVGAIARLAPSLLAGPPRVRRRVPDQYVACADAGCRHNTCRWKRERRLLDEHGIATDWVDGPAGPVWVAQDGADALTWETTTEIRCPHCKATWTSTSERRVLARRLAELGDARPDAAALVT